MLDRIHKLSHLGLELSSGEDVFGFAFAVLGPESGVSSSTTELCPSVHGRQLLTTNSVFLLDIGLVKFYILSCPILVICLFIAIHQNYQIF